MMSIKPTGPSFTHGKLPAAWLCDFNAMMVRKSPPGTITKPNARYHLLLVM